MFTDYYRRCLQFNCDNGFCVCFLMEGLFGTWYYRSLHGIFTVLTHHLIHLTILYYRGGNNIRYDLALHDKDTQYSHSKAYFFLPVLSWVPHQPRTHTLLLKMSHPSNVGTPSWRVPCLRGTWRPRGCRALYRCRDAISLSLLFSVSRLSSVGSRVRRSKFSSKIPSANGPYPEGNVNKCWWSMF